MRLTLVRHSEVELKYLNKYNGHNDIALSDAGDKQAKELCKKLDKLKFDAIFCSDLRRTRQTIKYLKKKKSIIYTKDLREKSWGKHEGLSFDEIIHQKEIKYENFLQWIEALDGEDYTLYVQRIKRFFFTYLPSLKKENILIITHAGVIRVFQSILHNKSLIEVFGTKINYGDLIIEDI